MYLYCFQWRVGSFSIKERHAVLFVIPSVCWILVSATTSLYFKIHNHIFFGVLEISGILFFETASRCTVRNLPDYLRRVLQPSCNWINASLDGRIFTLWFKRGFSTFYEFGRNYCHGKCVRVTTQGLQESYVQCFRQTFTISETASHLNVTEHGNSETFMFRSKRSSLVRELWKLRIPQNDTESQNEKDSHECKAVIHSMLKRLKEKNLEILLRSIESKGREETPCVLLPNVELKMGKLSTDPHVLCCQIWRWPDLTLDTTLRRLPCCETDKDPLYVCCNPYHWSVQQNAESSYCAEKANCLTSGINWPSDISMEPDSTETGLTPTCRRNHGRDISDLSEGEEPGSEVTTHWCSVAYWELRQRVGRLYTLHEPYLCIFQDLPHGNGLSLSLVQEPTSVDCVKRTRDKIGLGLVLSREADGVWLYNRSGYPVFVNSPTLDNPSSRASVVIKVNPGYSMNIFNYDMASVLQAVKERHCLDGPYDPTSIRISFAKGWGPSYHRQFITSCPAWLEVLLNVNRWRHANRHVTYAAILC